LSQNQPEKGLFMTDNIQKTPSPAGPEQEVVVYGTRWCAATQYVRRYLDRHGVEHAFRDLDRDEEAAEQVRFWTGGYLSHPTVKIASDILVEPLSNEIQSALEKNSLV
jgi:mycoredoxin